jgi:glycine dehydrogenase subunit 2
MMMIRAYHQKQGNPRSKILIPDSAHGTNPATSTHCGYKTIQIKSSSDGLVDIEHLRTEMDSEVAALFLTNPNTLGLFESDILEIDRIVHEKDGILYLDGANLNGLLGLVKPGEMGFDLIHFNLHKTFSVPHGGGGPGGGGLGVNHKLAPFIPVPVVEKKGDHYILNMDRPDSIGPVHSFYGNFLATVRAYTYIRMLGAKGLKRVCENALINANYLLRSLESYYDLPFKQNCMHECVLSGDRQRKLGVRTLDIAKRLLDFGLHAPTIYFPLIVHEALMIEPTETESKESLDNFIDVMIQIANEAEKEPELLTSAPHTTPVRRLDEAKAAKELDVVFKA